jgi:hypothetical protein
MSLINDSIRNLEIAVAELKAALESEQVMNQTEWIDQDLIDQTNIRF